MSDDHVTLKVFLKDDIRLIRVKQSICKTFASINEVLRRAYPVLRTIKYKITWKDCDEDDITIVNEEDLDIAFAEMADDYKILYITLKTDDDEDDIPYFIKVIVKWIIKCIKGMCEFEINQQAQSEKMFKVLMHSKKVEEENKQQGNDLGSFEQAPPSVAKQPVSNTAVNSKDAQMTKAFEMLIQMGFDNENGILMYLLEVFEGNVAEVIKALTNMKN